MAQAQSCPTCNYIMYADVEDHQPKGTWVTYVCQNKQCATYVKSGNRYPEKLKKFVESR